MCNEAVDNYAHELKFVPDCCKAQKRCDKPLNTYASTVQFIRECYKAQEMCGKAVNRCFFVFDSIPDRYKPQERYDRVIYEDAVMLLYCMYRYKTQYDVLDKKDSFKNHLLNKMFCVLYRSFISITKL